MIYEQFLPVLEISKDYLEKRHQNSKFGKQIKGDTAIAGGLAGAGLGSIVGAAKGYIKGKRAAKDIQDKDEKKKVIRSHMKKGAAAGAAVGGVLGTAGGYLRGKQSMKKYSDNKHSQHKDKIKYRRDSIEAYKEWKADFERRQKQAAKDAAQYINKQRQADSAAIKDLTNTIKKRGLSKDVLSMLEEP